MYICDSYLCSILTAAKFQGAGVGIHGEVFQLHRALCRDGQAGKQETKAFEGPHPELQAAGLQQATERNQLAALIKTL